MSYIHFLSKIFFMMFQAFLFSCNDFVYQCITVNVILSYLSGFCYWQGCFHYFCHQKKFKKLMWNMHTWWFSEPPQSHVILISFNRILVQIFWKGLQAGFYMSIFQDTLLGYMVRRKSFGTFNLSLLSHS